MQILRDETLFCVSLKPDSQYNFVGLSTCPRASIAHRPARLTLGKLLWESRISWHIAGPIALVY